MRDCWTNDPCGRPKFRQLAEDLEKELEIIDPESYLEMNFDISDDSK